MLLQFLMAHMLNHAVLFITNHDVSVAIIAVQYFQHHPTLSVSIQRDLPWLRSLQVTAS